MEPSWTVLLAARSTFGRHVHDFDMLQGLIEFEREQSFVTGPYKRVASTDLKQPRSLEQRL